MAKQNKPTKPALWSAAKSQARAKFDVYPSAYANAWAVKSISQWVAVGELFQRKTQRRNNMAGPKGVGLTKWFNQKWVNIGAPKKKGKFQPCGTSGAGGSGYAKCVPAAKARAMTPAQRKSAVQRKRKSGTPSKGVKGQAPKNVATFSKKKK